jgi:phenylacetate-coenzyme A ligase PaaK-like adenylate-forming protein
VTTYDDLRVRQQGRLAELMPALVAAIDLPVDELAALRRTRLHELIAVARARSPWHAARLAAVPTERLEPDDLTALPTMTKADLLEAFDSIVTDRRITLARVEDHLRGLDSDRYLDDRFHVLASGGSSGVRGVFVHDWDGFVYGEASMTRFGEREARRRGGQGNRRWVTSIVAGDRASHASAAAAATFDSIERPLHAVPASLPIADISAALQTQQPDLLAGYPSVLARLAQFTLAGNLTIRPTLVMTTAEPLTPTMEASIREAWGVPVVNIWALSECGAAAVTCPAGRGMHLSDDLVIIEPVDLAGRPVPPGVESDKVLITNLLSHAQPLIRYEVDDRVTPIDGLCPCGSSFGLIAGISGRSSDVFVYPAGATIHPVVFWSTLGQVPEISEYQVIQTPVGVRALVVMDGPVDLDGLRNAVTAGLARAGLADPTVDLEAVGFIARGPAGKLRRFMPL